MKKVLNVSLGGRSFAIEEDAYTRLSDYLEHFRARLGAQSGVPFTQSAEVMEDLESRISELFLQEVGTDGRVVNLALVSRVAGQLGMPDGAPESPDAASAASGPERKSGKKLYRDPENSRIAGVCAGLAAYLDADVVIVRIVMLVALIAGTAGFWVYVICWIAIPKAETTAQKCEMHGLPVTAENIARFSSANPRNK